MDFKHTFEFIINSFEKESLKYALIDLLFMWWNPKT